jgi:NitT/TauT family transport system ATP-binding protein
MQILIDQIMISFPRGKSNFVALNNLNLEIQKNEFVSIVGHSGCGKTTLLNLIAGFLKPTSGSLQFDGENISGPKSDRVVVFQEDAVFPWYSVKKNIAYSLHIRGIKRNSIREIVTKYISAVGLNGFDNYYPKDLSGGMKKRVDLARAYAANPKVLLMDEPFGSLDTYTRQQMQIQLLNLWELEKKTVIFVTHDINEAIFLSDRVVVLSKSPGTILKTFPIPFTRPRIPSLKKSQDFISLESEIEDLLHSLEL